MPTFDPEAIGLRPRLRGLQFITLALAAGCLAFGVVAYIARQGQPAGGGMEILVWLGVGMFFLLLTLSTLWPMLTLPAMLRRIAQGRWPAAYAGAGGAAWNPAWTATDEGKLLMCFQSVHVLRLALIEGGAFMNGIAFIVTGDWLSLGLLAAGAAAILVQLPTAARMENWLENRQQEVERLRAQGENDAARPAGP